MNFMTRCHYLSATADTVHRGFLDAELPPVIEIESGDRLTVDTISGDPKFMPPAGKGFDILPEYAQVFDRHPPGPGPHIMTGPIRVVGAEPGQTLEVKIIDVRLRQNWGYNVIRPLAGAIPEDFGQTLRLMHIPISIEDVTARLPWGATLKLAPFFGLMATAPPRAYGQLTSMIPREFGGNLDNKELRPGTSLFLPIFNAGAQFSVGDGHAVQGDGEACVTAIETAMRGTFELILHKDVYLNLPRAETPTHYMTMGFDVDLDNAAKQAVREMIVLLGEKAGLSREDAYTLISLACDVRVTQLVNGNKGIHALIPKSVVHI